MGFGNMHRLATRVAMVSAAAVSLAGVANAATYNGNGAAGFGGSIGNSVLTVTDGGATIDFSLATSGFNGNVLGIFLDTVAGGANDTSTFTDSGDNGRRALSGTGNNGTTRSLATFAGGFGADYGISLEPGGFAGIFNLSTPSAFGFVASGGLDTTATMTLNFSVNKADVGLAAAAGSFSFVASLINPADSATTVYRSNETIGASTTTPTPGSADGSNAGTIGTTTFSASNTFTYGAAVPEPTTLAALVAGGAALAGRRRRHA